MALVLNGGRAITATDGYRAPTLAREIHSWSSAGVSLGSSVDFSSTLSSGEAVLRNPDWVYENIRSVKTVIRFLASNLAKVGMDSFISTDVDDSVKVTDTDLAFLLKKPNPYQTPYDFWFQVIVDLCKHERSLGAMVLGEDGKPEVHLIPSRKWKFVRNGLDQPVAVEIDHYGVMALTPGAFWWVDHYPSNVDGMNAIYDELQEERSGSKYRQKLWRKGARIGGVVERPVEAAPWTRKARDRWMAEFAKAEAEGAAGGHTALLEEGMKYVRTRALSPSDAQQIEKTKLTEAMVAAYFGVSPVFVGLMDNANYSNVTAFHEQLHGGTLGSWYRLLEDSWNCRVVPYIGQATEHVRFEPNFLTHSDRVDMVQKQTGTPVLSINEGRKILGYPTLGEDYDEVIIPIYIQEEESSTEDPDPSADTESEDA